MFAIRSLLNWFTRTAPLQSALVNEKTAMTHPSWLPPAAQQGTLHRYHKGLTAFEHIPTGASPSSNVLIFVGGLSDGLLTVHYPSYLAAHMPKGWSLVQILLSSSYTGWGITTLMQDAEEISKCVAYFRRTKGEKAKVVLMGHSTGAQDVMEYLTGRDAATRPEIQGGILQGGLSDRQAAETQEPEMYKYIVKLATELVEQGRPDDVIPASAGITLLAGTPVTAYRWLSLTSPNHDGDDDYFSSDLSEDRLRGTFGTIGPETRMMFVLGEKDPHIPTFVDRGELIKMWTRYVKEGGGVVDEKNSGVPKGMRHNLNDDDEEVVVDLSRRVNDFLSGV